MHCVDVEPGYLAHPDAGAGPGVVVIHDVWGLAEHTRDLARRFAAEGFAALAVDLYRRLPGRRIDDAGRWIRALPDPQLLEEVQGAIDFLAGHPATAGRRIGVVGFCMGGMYALLAAARCRGLSLSVAFYGLLSHRDGMLAEEPLDPAKKPLEPLAAVAALRCPVLAFFGDDDELVPPAHVAQLRERAASAPHPVEIVGYPGAGHAFLNDTRPDAFRPAAAADAWARTLAALRRAC
jgi:carboxymethylenebutenolidase